jgi:hypothetical protein
MPQRLQLPEGSVVLSNRFGHGLFNDCPRFVRVQLPQGVAISRDLFCLWPRHLSNCASECFWLDRLGKMQLIT